MRKHFWRGAALFSMLVWSVAAAHAQQPIKIRIGWVGPSQLTPFLGQVAFVMPHAGKSYVIDAIRFQGSSPQITAMAAGELDLASFPASAVALGVNNAKIDLRVVSDVVQDGAPGYFTQPYVVRKDGPVKKVEDLRGRRVATNAIGSGNDSMMRAYLHRHGLQDRDFTTVEVNFTNMPAMLAEGKVDMIVLPPQTAQSVMKSGEYVPLFTMRDVVGLSQSLCWVMPADFIAKNRAALLDFFEDYIKAVRWFSDPKNHDQAVNLAAAAIKVPPATLAHAFTTGDLYRSPDARPDIGAIQREINIAVELGVLKAAFTVAPRYVDLSLIEEAKKRIDK